LTQPLLHVEHLSYEPETRHGPYQASAAAHLHPLHDLSFDVNAGEAVALIGHTGSGKSALTRTLSLLTRPTAGKVVFEGKDLTRQSEGSLRPVRRRLQVLFGDPRTALNPASLVTDVMHEPLRVQRVGKAEQQLAAVKTALRQVGLNSLLLDRRLTALSAGERQRVALARLLTLNPAIILCDDPARTLPPLSAEQLFKLMADVRTRHGTAFVWAVADWKPIINHADYVGVLYNGWLVEFGRSAEVLQSPQHPYTRQLLSPTPPPARTPLDPKPPSKGCPFQDHCPYVMPTCRQQMPGMFPTPTTQSAACFLFSEAEAKA
jgi:oligopeptide/dipeptide ABC transporter ATP-binding protein